MIDDFKLTLSTGNLGIENRGIVTRAQFHGQSEEASYVSLVQNTRFYPSENVIGASGPSILLNYRATIASPSHILQEVQKYTCVNTVPSQSNRKAQQMPNLNGKSLDLLLESLDLARQLRQLVGADAGGNDGTAHTASTSEQRLARDVDVRDALVFADEGDVEDDGERLGVGGQDGKLASTTVDGLGDCRSKELVTIAMSSTF